MPRAHFHPDPQCYIDHYVHQTGGSIPVYHGDVIQEGYGLGGLISGLFRSAFPLIKKAAIPILKSGAKAAGQHLLKTAGSALMDKLDAKPAENKQIPRKRKKRIRVSASKKRKHPDIFDR